MTPRQPIPAPLGLHAPYKVEATAHSIQVKIPIAGSAFFRIIEIYDDGSLRLPPVDGIRRVITAEEYAGGITLAVRLWRQRVVRKGNGK